MGPIVRARGGSSKGLNGFLDLSSEDEGGGFGLLAREGEKRSWNWVKLSGQLWETRTGLEHGKTYRDRVWVQEGDLGCVEIDVAIGLRLVECRSHEIWEVGWHLDRRHLTRFAPKPKRRNRL